MSRESKLPIKFVITDVDGILTPPCFIYTVDGKVAKQFSVSDSLMMDLYVKFYGVEIIALTGDASGMDVTKRRFSDINLDIDVHECKNSKKAEWVKAFIELNGLSKSEVIYLGDDIYDFLVFDEVEWSATVPSALPHIKKFATYVAERDGGSSAFSEILWAFAEGQGRDVIADIEEHAGS